MDDNTDAQQPGTAYAAPKSWRDEVQRLSQFANTAMDMSSRDQRNCLEYVAQRLADMLREDAIPTSADQQAAPGARITLDFKQAAALLKMFGAEPCEITLTDGDGHAGRGLYAHYTDMPEEGSTYLGVSADAAEPEAAPAAVAGPGDDSLRLAVNHAHEILRRLMYHRDGEFFINVNRHGAEALHVSTIATIVHAALAAAPATQPAPVSCRERHAGFLDAPQWPIDPEVSANLERSDWTPEEALRWYAAGKHYDTVPNGDGSSSARILDNGEVASNALRAYDQPATIGAGPGRLLAEHVLGMDFVTDRGLRARELARKVLDELAPAADGLASLTAQAAPAAVAGPSISQVTEQMRAAGDHAWMTSDGVDSGRVFWAMLAAAPTTQPSPASQGDALSQAARDVLAERQRQISAEGWSIGAVAREERAAFEAWWRERQLKTFPKDYDRSRLENWGSAYKPVANEAWHARAARAGAVAQDSSLLDWLRETSCDLRSIDMPTGAGDAEVRWIVVEHHMAKPHEREIGRSFRDDPREAIRAAMTKEGGV